MKLRFPIVPAASVALCGAVLAITAGAFRAQADQWDKRTVLTVDQPIQVRDTYLEPGTYVFKLANSSADRHIVQIFNADESHIINTVLAIPNYRLEPTGRSRFMFWETPPGTARALRAWFYPGDNFGQEFQYPKEPRQLAALITPALVPTPPPTPEPTVAAPEPITPEPAPPAPQPQAAIQEPTREEPPAETAAELDTPAPPPQPQAEPTPAASSEPQELPKTASPYPTVLMAGLFSLGLYSLIRRKDSA
jgi:hypothetical protein